MSNDTIVVNGFFPAMRAKYHDVTYAPRGIQWYIISWKESDVKWEDYRTHFVGATNPAKAVPNSIRNYMLNNYQALGLLDAPQGSDNGIHASASPVEAAYEIGQVWRPNKEKLMETQVWLEGRKAGVSEKLLIGYLTNENDISFDICEHRDLSACINLMTSAQAGINARKSKKKSQKNRKGNQGGNKGMNATHVKLLEGVTLGMYLLCLWILYFDGSQTILSFLFQYEMSNILVHLTKDSIEHSAA
jgi:hypothetical protein